MFKLIWLTPLLLVGLTACTSNFVPSEVNASGEYIGWHCEGDVNSRELWRCSKKTMKEGMPVDMAATSGDDTEQLLNDPVTALPSSLTTQPQSSSESSAGSKEGYTIQVGAYADRQVAVSVAEALAVKDDIRIVDIVVRGQNLFALVLGHYSSLEEAQQVADELLSGQESYWIRTMRSLSDAAAQ